MNHLTKSNNRGRRTRERRRKVTIHKGMRRRPQARALNIIQRVGLQEPQSGRPAADVMGTDIYPRTDRPDQSLQTTGHLACRQSSIGVRKDPQSVPSMSPGGRHIVKQRLNGTERVEGVPLPQGLHRDRMELVRRSLVLRNKARNGTNLDRQKGTRKG